MDIYIVRHGEVPHNVLKQYNSEDEDLTENGVIQANELKSVIKNLSFDAIISSPLIRAWHTANIININNQEIILDERLKERNPGNLSGNSLDITNRNEYWNYNTMIQYGTSESIRAFFDRIYDFLEELKTKDYKCVLIVAHSGVTKAFNAYFEGINDGLFLNKGLKNCEIKKYTL